MYSTCLIYMKPCLKTQYLVNTPYALTLSPCDKYQFAGRIDRYAKFRNFWYEQFLSLQMKYEMFIEISEPLNQTMLKKGSLGPRLHLHGVIEFHSNRDIGTFLLSTIHKWLKLSNVYVHTIDDLDVWSSYYNKQKLFKKNRLSSFHLEEV